MSVQPVPAQAPERRRPWVTPTLMAHASLAALTLQQYPQGVVTDSGFDPPQRAVPCSQGFCP
jgi:hypothetical protein